VKTILQRETIIGPGRISVWGEWIEDGLPVMNLKRQRVLVTDESEIPAARHAF